MYSATRFRFRGLTFVENEGEHTLEVVDPSSGLLCPVVAINKDIMLIRFGDGDGVPVWSPSGEQVVYPVCQSYDDVKLRVLAMLRTPEFWPQYQILPMKRYRGCKVGDSPKFGVATKHGKEYTIIAGDIFTLGDGDLERKDYLSAQAVVDDGWVVD